MQQFYADHDLITVSSTLIQIPSWVNLLLDAGEGTWGQFVLNFGIGGSGPSNAWEALRNLKCIFISHIHADHHSGLAKILSMRSRVCYFYIFICLYPLTLCFWSARTTSERTSVSGCTYQRVSLFRRIF